MNNFAAIDFETANEDRASVCSVGIVIVRDGKITEKFHSFIKPTPNRYTYFTTRVHGLTRKDTDDADIFPAVWGRIADKLEGLPLVAHNSTFDEGCLKAAFKVYMMDYPDYTFHCTCRAARRVFGKELPDHKLPTVAARCGYNLDNHHEALADATAAAVIGMTIL